MGGRDGRSEQDGSGFVSSHGFIRNHYHPLGKQDL